MTKQQMIQKLVEDSISQAPGEWGVVCKGLTMSLEVQHNPDVVFASASLIKLPILVAIMVSAKKGLLDLDTLLAVDHSTIPEDDLEGSGIIIRLTSPLKLTIRDLCVLMIIASDNYATNMLIDLLGMQTINQTLESLGLVNTRVTCMISHFEKLRNIDRNPITPAETCRLLEMIYRGELPNSELMQEILRRQIYGTRIPMLLPYEDDDLIIAHKTGTLKTVAHDAGFLRTSRGDYILCVLTQRQPAVTDTNMAIAQLSANIYQAFAIPIGE
jgi:beta-lactamase class A